MLCFRWRGIECRVSVLFPALITALLLYRDDTLTVTCLLASLVHEGGHLLAMLLLRVPPKECVLGLFGLRIRLVDHLRAYGKSIWVALAGPLANGLSAAILLQFGCTESAWVHIFLATFNLLPVMALDGGEIVYCLLCAWGREDERLLRITSFFIILTTMIGGAWLMWAHHNPTLWIVGAYLAAMAFFLDKNEKNT